MVRLLSFGETVVSMYHSMRVHSSVDGYLGCLQLQVIMKYAALNTCVQDRFV